MAVSRECLESPLYQSPNEKLAYNLTTTPWGAAPTSLLFTMWDITDSDNPQNVTSTALTGSASVAGNIITTKFIHSLTKNNNYRLDMAFTDADLNEWEAFCIFLCR